MDSASFIYDRLVKILRNRLVPIDLSGRYSHIRDHLSAVPPTKQAEQIHGPTRASVGPPIMRKEAADGSHRLLQNLPQPDYLEFINRDLEIATILERIFRPS